jgi:curved DNA-binding protein CbpA
MQPKQTNERRIATFAYDMIININTPMMKDESSQLRGYEYWSAGALVPVPAVNWVGLEFRVPGALCIWWSVVPYVVTYATLFTTTIRQLNIPDETTATTTNIMSNEKDSIPHYLMPVAAVLAMYAFTASCRTLFLIYRNFKTTPSTTSTSIVPPSPVVSLRSRSFYFLVSSIVVSVFLYAKIVAIIDKAMQIAEFALFNPYEILGVTESQAESNRTFVRQQYRHLVKQHHPDKGGDAAYFHRIHLAYKTLTDETARRQYELYGHPDGQVTVPTLEFALPSWLLRPTGMTAVTLVILYFGMFVGIIAWVVSYLRKEEKNVQQTLQTMSVALGDTKHFAKVLSPDSTHLDVLLAVATTPENIEWAVQLQEKEDKMRQERLAQMKSKSSFSGGKTASFELDQAGWADEGERDDDDEEDEDKDAKEAEEKAKQADIEKEKQRKELELATGKAVVLMEGVDEGVIGRAWVEKVLTNKGQWPPTDLRFVADQRFEYKGKQFTAMEHPGVRRNLCITIGRLNAQTLNTHPELRK